MSQKGYFWIPAVAKKDRELTQKGKGGLKV
jgi:hypothetical protein